MFAERSRKEIIATLTQIRADLFIPFHLHSAIVTILVTWF